MVWLKLSATDKHGFTQIAIRGPRCRLEDAALRYRRQLCYSVSVPMKLLNI
jgi:hypothetical protein